MKNQRNNRGEGQDITDLIQVSWSTESSSEWFQIYHSKVVLVLLKTIVHKFKILFHSLCLGCIYFL